MRQLALLFGLAALATGCAPTPAPAPPPIPDFIHDAPKQPDVPAGTGTTTVKVIDNPPGGTTDGASTTVAAAGATASADVTMQLKINDPVLAAGLAAHAASQPALHVIKTPPTPALLADEERRRALAVASAVRLSHEPAAERRPDGK